MKLTITKLIVSMLMLLPAGSHALAADNEPVAANPASETGSGQTNPASGDFPFKYICEGTVWEYIESYQENMLGMDVSLVYRNIEKIEGTKEVNGKTYMVAKRILTVNDKDIESLTLYIRTEGECVYAIHPHDIYSPEREFILFDYSLQPTEEVETKIVGVQNSVLPEENDVIFTCVDVTSQENCGNEFTVMSISSTWLEESGKNGDQSEEESQTSFADENLYPVWIRGLGSGRGLLANSYGSQPSKYFNRETNVYHNGVLIYTSFQKAAGIKEIQSNSGIETSGQKKYRTDGNECRDGDKGICISAGKKIIVR